MEQRLISIRDGREKVEIVEAGTGPAVVYFPDIWGLRWDPFLEALSQDFHVVAARLPGTGGTTGDDAILDVQDLTFFFADFISALDATDISLAGHGLGGMLAAELAAMEPARYRRLLLIAPFGIWNDSHPNEDIFFVRDATDEQRERMFTNPLHPMAEEIFAAQPGQPGATAVDRARHYQTAAKYLWPLPDRGLRKRVHRVTAPTLIAWGQRDPVGPSAYADDFKKLIKPATVSLFEHSAHFPQIEECDQFAQSTAAFLRD